MSNRDELNDLMVEYALDPDAMPVDQRRKFEASLEASPELKNALAATRTVLEEVDRLPRSTPSPGFDRAMQARLNQIDESSRSLWSRVQGWFAVDRRRPVFAAISLVAAVVIGWLVIRPIPTAPAPQQLAAGVDVEALEIAEDLELFQDLELYENLDVLADLDAIEALDDGGA